MSAKLDKLKELYDITTTQLKEKAHSDMTLFDFRVFLMLHITLRDLRDEVYDELRAGIFDDRQTLRELVDLTIRHSRLNSLLKKRHEQKIEREVLKKKIGEI